MQAAPEYVRVTPQRQRKAIRVGVCSLADGHKVPGFDVAKGAAAHAAPAYVRMMQQRLKQLFVFVWVHAPAYIRVMLQVYVHLPTSNA